MIHKKSITFLLILFFGVSCNVSQNGFIKPINNLPNTEIAYLIENTANGTIIGFINSDGSQKTERGIFFNTGFLFDSNFVRYFSSDTSTPFAWTKGKYLGLLKNSSNRINAGFPIVVLPNGIVKKCPDKDSPWTTKPFYIERDVLFLVDESINEMNKIIRFNYETCRLENVVYQPPLNEKIDSFSLSSTGKIAINISKKKNNTIKHFTRIISQSTKDIVEFPDSIQWTWGKNNKNFYFKLPNYDVVICEEINQFCKNLGNKIDHPSFSEDEKWLIYDFAGKIYRKNIENLSIEYVVDGSFPITSN